MTLTDPVSGREELIARLERLTGSDRELDFLIFEATAFPSSYFGSPIESWSRDGGAGYCVNTADGYRHLSAFNAPYYTNSIDAKLPDEDIISTSEQKQQVGQPVIWVAVHRPPTNGKPPIAGHGRTEAIARRVAALRARSP